MSSYFSEIEMGRSSKVVEWGSYMGVAPEFTTVLYKPGDYLGLVSAMASLVPVFVCVALLTVFMCRRTADDMWIGLGQIACEILNGIIKVYVKQPRPMSPVSNIPADSFGMPSAHSQYMGYFAMIITVHTLNAPALSPLYRLVRITGVMAVSMFVAYSRYYLYYHTGPQVIIGFLVGSILGFCWLQLGNLCRKLGLVRWAVSLYPCRLLLIKDVQYSVFNEFEEYEKSIDKAKSE